MLKAKTVAVVIPAYNEENQIGAVVKSIPVFVDRIVIVNDASTDETEKVVLKCIKNDKHSPPKFNGKKKIKAGKYNRADVLARKFEDDEINLFTPHKVTNKDPEKNRIILINHEMNANVGAAIATGYKWCKDHSVDCTAVMAGDGQMDPSELKHLCLPVINGEVDYVKANRLKHRSALFVVPKIRFFGNSVLSLLTKIASGYWRVSDTQTGYTAISLKALKAIRLHKIYKSYGCPNDILVKLNIAFCTIKEVESKPIYNIGEKSKMNELLVVPGITWLLFKSFWKRLYIKYLFRDFHPLFMLYHFAFLLLIIDIPFTYEVADSFGPDTLSMQSLLIFVFLTISGFQSLFFAMWMDMMDNERLYK
jgi:glycosyltransferase involved in cell wall biosynthesis